MNDDPFSLTLIIVTLASALAVAGITVAILYQVLGLSRHRYEVDAGLSQLGEISWHELQVLIGLGLRGKGWGAVSSNDRDDAAHSGDVLLSNGKTLTLLRVKHGSSIKVDKATLLDLANRKDVRRAQGAMLATTGKISRSAAGIAGELGVEVLAGDKLWNLVSDHLPPRLRERIANRRRRTLRNRLGLAIGCSALAAAGVLAVSYHVTRGNFDSFISGAGNESALVIDATVNDTQPVDAEPTVAAPVVASPESQQPAEPTAVARAAPIPAVPLDAEALTARRRQTVLAARELPTVINAKWSTASTLEVLLRSNAKLQEDTLFGQICDVLRPFEELRLSRIQIELSGGDPSKGPIARWKQCQ